MDRTWKTKLQRMGILLATSCLAVNSVSCSREDIRALVAGLEAATAELDNDEITLGDWLSSELDD